MYTKIFFHFTWISAFMATGAFDGLLIFQNIIWVLLTAIMVGCCLLSYHLFMDAKKRHL